MVRTFTSARAEWIGIIGSQGRANGWVATDRTAKSTNNDPPNPRVVPGRTIWIGHSYDGLDINGVWSADNYLPVNAAGLPDYTNLFLRGGNRLHGVAAWDRVLTAAELSELHDDPPAPLAEPAAPVALSAGRIRTSPAWASYVSAVPALDDRLTRSDV